MSSKKTVCLFLSYFGHFYRGSQYQPPPHPTVVGSIQSGLLESLKLKNVEELKLKIASRTDAGVHALVNVVSTHLPPKYSSLNLRRLQKELNTKFSKENQGIRVTGIRWANEEFDIRKTLGKTYVYRLGLLPVEMEDIGMKESDMNILTYKTAGFVRKPEHGFDIKKFHSAGQILSGVNDFSLFRVPPDDLERKHFQCVVRSVSITIEPGLPSPLSSFSNSQFDRCEYWNIVVSGQGFMHKQFVGAEASTSVIAVQPTAEPSSAPDPTPSSSAAELARSYPTPSPAVSNVILGATPQLTCSRVGNPFRTRTEQPVRQATASSVTAFQMAMVDAVNRNSEGLLTEVRAMSAQQENLLHRFCTILETMQHTP